MYIMPNASGFGHSMTNAFLKESPQDKCTEIPEGIKMFQKEGRETTCSCKSLKPGEGQGTTTYPPTARFMIGQTANICKNPEGELHIA